MTRSMTVYESIGDVDLMHYVSLFFFKQKTAYEMRISDWSSDVCSSDLGQWLDRPIAEELARAKLEEAAGAIMQLGTLGWVRVLLAQHIPQNEIGRASCRDRVCQ